MKYFGKKYFHFVQIIDDVIDLMLTDHLILKIQFKVSIYLKLCQKWEFLLEIIL